MPARHSDDHEPIAGQAELTEAITRRRLHEFRHLDGEGAREKTASVMQRFGVFERTEEEEKVIVERNIQTQQFFLSSKLTL